MNDVKTWQGYLEEDGGRRPGHLVLYPIEVKYTEYATQYQYMRRLQMINIDYAMQQFLQITFLGVSLWRNLLGAGLLPGHICSYPRNQELPSAWKADHLVWRSPKIFFIELDLPKQEKLLRNLC